MNFFTSLVVFSVLALAGRDAYIYATTPGTPAQRLAACWKGTLTLFFGVWGSVASALTVGLDALAQLTDLPEFTQLASAVQAAIPAQYHPWVPVASMAAMMLARLRTAGK